MEVACRGHHREGGIQEGKNQGTKTKQTRATTYNMRRARKATIYIYKWCKTAQAGRQSKDKDNGIKIRRRERGTAINIEFSTISTLESVISVSSDYLCINWYGSSLGVHTRVGVPRLQCLGQ